MRQVWLDGSKNPHSPDSEHNVDYRQNIRNTSYKMRLHTAQASAWVVADQVIVSDLPTPAAVSLPAA